MSNQPAKLSDVLTKLQETYRELERMQQTVGDDDKDVSLLDNELLRMAKILSFIWNSRNGFVDDTLFADPGWLILLHLKIVELEHGRVQVSTVCIDSGAPATTALRWIKRLESKSLVRIEPDDFDKRRKFVFLTERGSNLIGKYLQNIRDYIGPEWVIS